MTNKDLMQQLSDFEVLWLTIVGEARSESIEGQVAVGNVILTRSRTRKKSIKEVCLAPKQFSCWNEGDPNRKKLVTLAKKILSGANYANDYPQIQWVASGIVSNKLSDNVKGRDHYMTTSLWKSDKRPSWAKFPKTDPIVIGNHIFLNV